MVCRTASQPSGHDCEHAWRQHKEVIVWAKEDDEEPRIAYQNLKWEIDGPEATDATPKDLVELCDSRAEGGNYHDFVGCHGVLLKLFLLHTDEATASAMMREIAELGGLSGMMGLGR